MSPEDILNDKELREELKKAQDSLASMPISQRLIAWGEINGKIPDTSALNYNPNFTPPTLFDPTNINSVFGVNVSYNITSNKIEPVKTSLDGNKKEFHEAQLKSQDNLISLAKNSYEAIKLVDITGILHWRDLEKAEAEFKNNPNSENGLNLILCTVAVIPATGIASKPLKAATSSLTKTSLKEGIERSVLDLSKEEKELRLGPAIKEVNKLLKSQDFPQNISKDSLEHAMLMHDKSKNRVNPIIPKNVFKEMIDDFKASGGKFKKRTDYGNFHDHSDNIVILDPKAGSFKSQFRSVIAHEMGHSFTTPRDPWTKESPISEPAFLLTKNKTKNPYDWRHSKNFKEELNKTIYKELNADLEVLRRMEKGGATQEQLSRYAEDAKKSIQSYKRGFFINEPSLYSDAIATKKVLLDDKTYSQVAKKVLHYKPELMSDFTNLTKELSKEFKKQGNDELAKKITEIGLGNLEGKLYVEKTIAENHFLKIKNKAWEINDKSPHIKDNGQLAILKYMEKNLEGFSYYRNLINEQVGSLRLKELENYTIEKNEVSIQQ
jgi:hypothetical protein